MPIYVPGSQTDGLIGRVWYNEWIAEVYQGRDLIYKEYNVADTGFVWEPGHGTQYEVPELADTLDIRVETNGSTTVRLDHVGRWEVQGSGAVRLTPEMSGRVLTFIGGSPSVHGLEEELPLYLISLTYGLQDHSETRSLSPYQSTNASWMVDDNGLYALGTQPNPSLLQSGPLGNETVSFRVWFSGAAGGAYDQYDRGVSFFFGSENTSFRLSLSITDQSPTRLSGDHTATFNDSWGNPRDIVGYSFELGLNRWISRPDEVLVSYAVIDPSNTVVLNKMITTTPVGTFRQMMTDGGWYVGLSLFTPNNESWKSHTVDRTNLQYSIPRHEYES